MDMGARVKVVRGRRSIGATGVVFWVGENRYGPGQRLGIHSDDGLTLWIDRDHVVAVDGEREVSVSLHDESEQERAARQREDLQQIAVEIARAEKSPVHLAPYDGSPPKTASHASQKREWVDNAARRVALPPEFGEVRGADERGHRLLLCGDFCVVEADVSSGELRELKAPKEKERLLDVAWIDDERWALLTVDRLYLLGPECQVLCVANVKRDVIEAVFDGRGLVVYGDYGEPMLYGVAHDRLKRLGTTRARVEEARVVDGRLVFEAHAHFYEMVGALSAIEAFERSAARAGRRPRDNPPACEWIDHHEPPAGIGLLSPWSIDDEASRFPGHPLLARAPTGRIVAAWDPRVDLRGDLPRRTRLGLSDAPDHLRDVSQAVTDHLERAITDLAVDPTGRWIFFQGHRTIQRLDLESLEVVSVYPKALGFHPADARCLVVFLGNELVWLEQRGGAWHEAARAKTAKARLSAYCPSLDCAFLFGDGASKVQVFARVGDRAARVWTTKEPFIRASFAGPRVFLYRHARSMAELAGFSELLEHARRKKQRA